jgi:lactate dehydrogenase-like 2-hydroxyacid dehydrogenase
MTKPVLLITRRLPSAVETRAVRDYDARLNPEDLPRSGTDIVRLAEGAAAILCCPAERVDAGTIAALPDSVRVIATFSVGYDHVAVEAAAALGIAVCNTPGVLSAATAETAMLLILAAARRAGEGERLVRSGKWQGWAPTQLIGTQVSGRRLGIFGMGRIGRELARMTRAFDMQVHYRDQARLLPLSSREQSSTTPTRAFSRRARCCRSMRPVATPPATGSMPSVLRCCRRVRWSSMPHAARWSTTRL